jgi:isopentenyldiphosphate isomerase
VIFLEYVPVVDEEDQYLFDMRRELVHDEKNPLWHRSVTVLTFRTENRDEILIQRRSRDKERKPGLLEFAGGHVLSGEEYREAAIREYAEELLDRRAELTSIDMEDFRQLEKIDKKSPDNYEKVSVYSTVYDGPLDLSDEVMEAEYVSVQELAQDIEQNPENYTNSTLESFRAYNEAMPTVNWEQIRSETKF